MQHIRSIRIEDAPKLVSLLDQLEYLNTGGCSRIELHCNIRRVQAHKFYYRQGYYDSPKYLMKEL